MREFLEILENEFKVVTIEEEISTKYEASKILKEHDKDVIIFENIKKSDIRIISGICNTREKIARALSINVPGISSRIIEAMENPIPIKRILRTNEKFHFSKKADLSELHINLLQK